MSKKVAEGLNGLVMDIKVGNGAFMKTLQEAKVLANELKRIGQSFGIKTDIIFSNMSQPLGSYAGLQCEVLEALDCLRGKGPDDLVELSLELGSKIMIQSGLFKDSNESKIKMLEHLNNGKAFDKFEKMILNCADFSCAHCVLDSPQPSALTTDQSYIHTHRLSSYSWPQKAIQTKKEIIRSVCSAHSYDTSRSRFAATSAPA